MLCGRRACSPRIIYSKNDTHKYLLLFYFSRVRCGGRQVSILERNLVQSVGLSISNRTVRCNLTRYLKVQRPTDTIVYGLWARKPPRTK
jgi:hypothetical protein